jgi:pyridoxal biosynthesis lyase PdxS
VSDVMRDRGYPVENFEQRAADVSVDHPLVVDNYRAAGAITVRAQRGEATTEDLRQAMRHFRSLFEELLDDSSDQPLDRDQAAAEQMRNEPSLKREVTR